MVAGATQTEEDGEAGEPCSDGMKNEQFGEVVNSARVETVVANNNRQNIWA